MRYRLSTLLIWAVVAGPILAALLAIYLPLLLIVAKPHLSRILLTFVAVLAYVVWIRVKR
jgi:cell division protein FtsW (lipid II flippase)